MPGGIAYDVAPHPSYLLAGLVGAIDDLQVVTRTDARGHVRELRAVVDGERALGSLTLSLETRPLMSRVVLYGSAMTADVESQQHDPDRASRAPGS